MKQWKINEQIAYEWVKKNLDLKAELHGGSDNRAPDITLSNGDIYEVKSLFAQCGQFTSGTANQYAYSDEVQEYFLGLDDFDEQLKRGKNPTLKDHPICKEWVKAYYKNTKKVKSFLVVTNGKVEFQSLEDYFNKHTFSCTYRRKKSGSSTYTPGWVIKYIPSNWQYTVVNKFFVVKDSSLFGQRIKGYNTKGQECDIYIADDGRIKVLSNTYNPTWIFSVK